METPEWKEQVTELPPVGIRLTGLQPVDIKVTGLQPREREPDIGVIV